MLIIPTISGAHPDARPRPAFPTEGHFYQALFSTPGKPWQPGSHILLQFTMPRNVGHHAHQKRRIVTHSAGETESHMAKRAGNRLIGLAAEPHTPHLV